jgi:hypothetical protein
MSIRYSAAIPVLATFLFASSEIFAQDKTVALRAVDHAGLKQAVLKQRGKVLIVDFWGEF